MRSLADSVRLAWRSWRSTPGVAAAMLVTLALGIGANTAIFSLVNGVLLRPLPFPAADRLVMASVSSPGDPRLPPQYMMFGDLEAWRRSASMDRLSTFTFSGRALQGVDGPERVDVVTADGAFFETLGTPPLAGRTLTAADSADVAVISFDLWQRALRGDRDAIGRAIVLDDARVTVVGIMPAGFQFPYRATRVDLWTPRTGPPPASPDSRLDLVVGRMKPGVSIETVRQELTTLAAARVPGRHANVTPLGEVIGGPVRTTLLVLLGAVGLVMLIGCANVANLLLARAVARRRDVAVRLALGATRWSIARQHLVETMLLSCAGGALGLVLGLWLTRVVVALAGPALPRAFDIQLDWRVFVFLATVSTLIGAVFGAVPALVTSDTNVQQVLKSGERGQPARGRLRDLLAVAELALAFVLLVGAGLLLRTLVNLRGTDAGFAPAGVLTVHVAASDAAQLHAIADRTARIPGVQAAGSISLLPLQNSDWWGRFAIAGGGEGSAEFRYVTPGYFRAMGVPLKRGRLFDDGDTAAAPRVLLVNETLARQYFPGSDPVGRELRDRGVIVGVVGDVRQARLTRAAIPELYYPVAQNFGQMRSVGSSLIVRSDAAAGALAKEIRNAIRDVDPSMPAFRVQTMDSVVNDSIATERLYLWLLGTFAAIGVLSALAGIHGVVAYLVALRTREFGIRAALGADRGQVMRLVLARGGVLTIAGLAIGLAGALLLTRLLGAVLFDVAPTDALTFGAALAALAATALGACVGPARRAARVDPAIALRSE